MTKKMNIPFSPPDISEKEIEAVSEALSSAACDRSQGDYHPSRDDRSF